MTAKTILIAEDDRDLAKALALRCESLGLRTQIAHDALSALNLIHEQAPDLVILDVNMPGGNGLSVCEMLSSDARLSSIPVVVMTGQSDEETIRRCHNLCAYYVAKCDDVWSRIEPLIQDLIEVDPKPRPLSQPASTA